MPMQYTWVVHCRIHPLSHIHTPARLAEDEQKHKREMSMWIIPMRIYDFLKFNRKNMLLCSLLQYISQVF